MKLCEVCGSPEHPPWKAHVFATNTTMANAGVANSMANDSGEQPLVEPLRATLATYRYRDPVARRKYQAELMRKRRSEGRA